MTARKPISSARLAQGDALTIRLSGPMIRFISRGISMAGSRYRWPSRLASSRNSVSQYPSQQSRQATDSSSSSSTAIFGSSLLILRQTSLPLVLATLIPAIWSWFSTRAQYLSFENSVQSVWYLRFSSFQQKSGTCENTCCSARRRERVFTWAIHFRLTNGSLSGNVEYRST